MYEIEDIHKAISEVLKENATAMQADGGGAVLDRIDDFVVYIKLVGACQVCPSRPLTIGITLEPSLRRVLPLGYDVKFL